MSKEEDNKLTTQSGRLSALPRGSSALHERLRSVQVTRAENGVETIMLLLDGSGSMNHIDPDSGGVHRRGLLHIAVEQYLQAADLGRNLVGIDSFPASEPCPPTSNIALLIQASAGSYTGGGTPMGQCLERVLQQQTKPTRCVIISDGDATDNPMRELPRLVESKIPVDCVHIGPSQSGEETLKEIAERTGGIYMKFSKSSGIVEGLKYLTPKYRALLQGPRAAELTGATEVKT